MKSCRVMINGEACERDFGGDGDGGGDVWV